MGTFIHCHGGVAERHRRFLIPTKAADRLEDQADAVAPGGSIGAMPPLDDRLTLLCRQMAPPVSG